uniref:Ubiquitin-like domain-containing protein n=1 Tax=Parascaris univalens TaxID=6257 RepID=A0A915AG39_PARUN
MYERICSIFYEIWHTEALIKNRRPMKLYCYVNDVSHSSMIRLSVVNKLPHEYFHSVEQLNSLLMNNFNDF